MNRTVLRLDRVLLALFGLVLVVVGVAALLWTTGTLAEYVDGVPDSLDTSGATTAASQTWWPYATGAVALLLAIVAVWWMLAHLPARSVPEQDLPGSSRAMRLRIDRGRSPTRPPTRPSRSPRSADLRRPCATRGPSSSSVSSSRSTRHRPARSGHPARRPRR